MKRKPSAHEETVEVAQGIFRPRMVGALLLIEIGRPIIECQFCKAKIVMVPLPKAQQTENLKLCPVEVPNKYSMDECYGKAHVCGRFILKCGK